MPRDLGPLEFVAELAPLPEGVELHYCPAGCGASVAGPGRILEHHGDGSHSMDWGGEVPQLVAHIDGLQVAVTVTGPTLRSV